MPRSAGGSLLALATWLVASDAGARRCHSVAPDSQRSRAWTEPDPGRTQAGTSVRASSAIAHPLHPPPHATLGPRATSSPCCERPVGCTASYAPLAPVACVNDCMGRGSCHDGVCECQPGWTYFDCSIRAPTRAPLRTRPDPDLTQPNAAVCRHVCCRLLWRRPVLQWHVPMPRRLLRRRLLAEVLPE